MTTPDEIQPARIDWRGYCYEDHSLQIRHETVGQVSIATQHPGAHFRVAVPDGPQRHALAALCLYRQPFGFTQEDVRVLAMLLSQFAAGGDWLDVDEHNQIGSLRARIAALLPPEEAK